MSICEGGYNQLYIFACKSNWPKYIILITMIDVRLQSLKPPAIQYASVQPQSTLRMTSRMGCCVLGQGFYPRSCYFKSELLFHQWGRRLFHMCWWHWLPPDDAWGWWTLFLPGASFSQDMSDCELWICSLHSAPLKCENPLRQDFLAGVLAVVVKRRLLCSPGLNIEDTPPTSFSKWWYNSLCTTCILLKALPSDMIVGIIVIL